MEKDEASSGRQETKKHPAAAHLFLTPRDAQNIILIATHIRHEFPSLSENVRTWQLTLFT